MPHLQTPHLQMAIFQMGVTVASGLCHVTNISSTIQLLKKENDFQRAADDF